jgi:hypothetical protein
LDTKLDESDNESLDLDSYQEVIDSKKKPRFDECIPQSVHDDSFAARQNFINHKLFGPTGTL